MDCRHYQESIRELVDGTIGPIRKAELQRHLDVCEACRVLTDDLIRLHELAADLETLSPPDGVWLQIAGRLRQEGRFEPAQPPQPVRRQALWLAIAATLLLAVGASLLLLMPAFRDGGNSATTTQAGGGNVPPVDPVESVAAEFRLAEQHYQNAIAKLEEAAGSDQGSIDPQTAAMLQKNLLVIDQAIAESRAALNVEPQSMPARNSLFDALRRKVVLLQDTIALMNEMRKGDAAGAAQVLDGINKS